MMTLERRQARAAVARARRATRRAEAAEARVVMLEDRITGMLQSKAWRITYPLRALSFALQGRSAPDPAPAVFAPECGPPACGAALAVIVDDNWPRPDRDAGSIEVVNLATSLLALGYEVMMVVDESRSSLSPAEAGSARQILSALGITAVALPDTIAFERFLKHEGRLARLFVLCRVFCGGVHFEQVRAACPDSRIIFNTIDLHYFRIAREADITGDPALGAVATSTRLREQFLAGEADLTFVVSETERAALETAVPDADVWSLPLARAVVHPHNAFSARAGIGFIGGFAHSPNLDGLRFFLKQVWPLVLQSWPECRFSIVGGDLPSGELDGAPGAVEYLGPVPDVGPWFESLLMTVAPLRFGAGVKGKVVSSMAAGVPCVITSIAAEGMGLQDGVDTLLAEDPAAMARHILDLRTNEALWDRLSVNGMAHVAASFSPDQWRATLRDALWTIDALPSANGV